MMWVGSLGGMEQPLLERAELSFELIPAAAIRGKNPLAAIKSLWMLSRGYLASRNIIRRFGPTVLFVTGGYVSVPATLAAWRSGVPVLIYLPDIEPGLAVKFLARFASRVAVTAAETCAYFKEGLTVVTGYPVRPELEVAAKEGCAAKAGARRQLDLDDDLPVLLVFGGSRGARSINQAVSREIKAYLEVCQVVHISGTLDETWVRARRDELSPELQQRYRVFAYLHEDMIAALLSADLVISRAGASVMGEYPAIGLPSILVPLPIAGGHQALNAAYLARHQAAIVVEDGDLKLSLRETAIDLIKNKTRLEAMSQACSRLARPDAALRLAQEIVEVGTHGGN